MSVDFMQVRDEGHQVLSSHETVRDAISACLSRSAAFVVDGRTGREIFHRANYLMVLAGLKEKTVTYRYYLISRPPFIGTHPAGNIAVESWDTRQDIPGTLRPAWGWVEYDQPLDFENVWNYELYPGDEKEADAYYDWRNEVGK